MRCSGPVPWRAGLGPVALSQQSSRSRRRLPYLWVTTAVTSCVALRRPPLLLYLDVGWTRRCSEEQQGPFRYLQTFADVTRCTVCAVPATGSSSSELADYEPWERRDGEVGRSRTWEWTDAHRWRWRARPRQSVSTAARRGQWRLTRPVYWLLLQRQRRGAVRSNMPRSTPMTSGPWGELAM